MSLACTSLLGQTKSIKGIIADEENKAVPFATVILKNSADSSLYKGEVTNDLGEFTIQDLKDGNYYLQVQSVGFTTLRKGDLVINDNTPSIDMGRIQLFKNTKELGTVTIQAEKPFIERQADKTVVNIENSIVQTGSSIMEVMEKLPGVLVDQDGNIRLRGKQGVIIMIDGKPATLSGPDLANMLRGMPSSNIQKIEIITNPSAKWDAAGNAGIINIVMKKNKIQGYNGNVSAGYGQGRYAKYNTAFSFSYKKDWYNLFVNYGYSNRKGFNNLTLNRKFYENDTLRTTFETNNYIIFPFSTHAPRIGADFYLSKSTTLSLLTSGVSNHFDPSANNHSDIFAGNNEKVTSYDFINDSHDKFYNYQANAQLRHRLDTLGQEITMDLDYGKYWNNTDQLFTTIFRDEASGMYTTNYLAGQQDGSLYLYSAKIDYTKPFKKDLTMEAGLKSSLVNSDKDMKFFNRINDVDHFDTARSSHFLYSENINAAYVSFNKKIKDLILQAGLRAEHTMANGEQKLNGETFKRNYVQVFPTVFIDYKMNEKHGINLSLGRRIDRPGYDQMNPYRRLIDAYTYSEGNPYLLPQLTYNAELSYSFKNTFFVTASYNYTTDNITDILIQDAATKTTVQAVRNLDEVNYYSLGLTYSKRMTKWWKTNTNVQSYLGKFTGTVNNYQIDQGKPSFDVSSNNSFSIMDGLSMECNLQYNNRNLYGVTLMNTTYNLSLGVQKSVMQKKGSITVNFTDILWTAYPSGVTVFGNVTEHWKSKRDTRVLNVSFSYKFGKGNAGKMRKDTGADDEKKRIQ
jgi:hypothetical protein